MITVNSCLLRLFIVIEKTAQEDLWTPPCTYFGTKICPEILPSADFSTFASPSLLLSHCLFLSHSLSLSLSPLPYLSIHLSIYTYFYYFSFLGMIQYAVDAIKGSLDDLPGLPRTNFGNIISPSLFHFTHSSFSFSTCFSSCSSTTLFFDFFLCDFLPTSQVS